MVTAKELRLEFDEWNSSMMAETPGANIDELSPVMKFMALDKLMSVHRSQNDQLCGFSGSNGESQSTRFISSGPSTREEVICAPPWTSGQEGILEMRTVMKLQLEGDK